jgi:hypothetical protein
MFRLWVNLFRNPDSFDRMDELASGVERREKWSQRASMSFLGYRRFVIGKPLGPPRRRGIALLSMHHTGGLAGERTADERSAGEAGWRFSSPPGPNAR